MIWLCAAEDVKPGSLVQVEQSPEIPVPLVLTNIEGRYYCMADVCSHRQTALSGGALDGYELVCPKHFSRFDFRTGEPDGLPARKPVPTYEVTVLDGNVYMEAGDLL